MNLLTFLSERHKKLSFIQFLLKHLIKFLFMKQTSYSSNLGAFFPLKDNQKQTKQQVKFMGQQFTTLRVGREQMF